MSSVQFPEHLFGLLIREPQVASRQLLQFFLLPVCSRDSRAGMGIRSQQEVSQFVRHHISQ